MTRRAPVLPASRRVERRTPTSRPTCRTADTARSDNDQQTTLHYTYGDQGLNWGGADPTGSQIRHLLFEIHYL